MASDVKPPVQVDTETGLKELGNCDETNLKENLEKQDRPKDKVCDICTKAFNSSKKLRRHKNEVHLQKRYQCQHCPKDFRRSVEVKRHVARDHLGQVDYLCDFCSKPFADKLAMSRHVRNVHTENKEVNTQ